MKIKPESVQPVTIDSWATRDNLGAPDKVVKPVPKVDTASGARKEGRSGTGQAGAKDPGEDPQQARALVGEVQGYLDNLNIQLHFQVDEGTGEPVVQVMDPESGDLIRQIPPEELLELRGRLEELRGILLDKKA